jgi:hypothetical protein
MKMPVLLASSIPQCWRISGLWLPPYSDLARLSRNLTSSNVQLSEWPMVIAIFCRLKFDQSPGRVG